MTFLPMVLVALVAVSGLATDRQSWHHAFFRSPSRQNPRPAIRGLGKTNGNSFIMAISPRKSRNHAKTHNPRPTWEKSKRNPFIMAITL